MAAVMTLCQAGDEIILPLPWYVLSSDRLIHRRLMLLFPLDLQVLQPGPF